MTYHSSMDFEFGLPITDEVVDEIVSGLQYNRDWNKEDAGKDCYTCGAYWVGSTVDACIENISVLLDQFKDKVIPFDEYNKWLGDSPTGVDELVRKVLNKMEWIIK